MIHLTAAELKSGMIHIFISFARFFLRRQTRFFLSTELVGQSFIGLRGFHSQNPVHSSLFRLNLNEFFFFRIP